MLQRGPCTITGRRRRIHWLGPSHNCCKWMFLILSGITRKSRGCFQNPDILSRLGRWDTKSVAPSENTVITNLKDRECTQFNREDLWSKITSLYIWIKVIRHVFGFWIEFLENKDIGIFGHFMVIDFITRYSYHTYFSPISTSWYRRFGTGYIVRNGEWRIFVNYFVFSALFPPKLRILFEEGILGTPVQKYPVTTMVISNYQRWKPNSTKTDLCIELSLFTSH